MALSYVWLLIKPSHRSLCVCCTAPSLIFLPHPSVPLCLCITHSQRRAHTRKRLYSGESPGFDQVLFDTVIRSEAQLVGPSLAVAPASRGISISISDVGLFSSSPPPPVWNQHSFFPLSQVSLSLPPLISLYPHVDWTPLSLGSILQILCSLQPFRRLQKLHLICMSRLLNSFSSYASYSCMLYIHMQFLKVIYSIKILLRVKKNTNVIFHSLSYFFKISINP